MCGSCRYASGCLRCVTWKAERYWLGMEDPQEERTESQIVAELENLQNPELQAELAEAEMMAQTLATLENN